MTHRVKINQKLIDNYPNPTDGKIIVLRDKELIGFTAHIGANGISYRLEKSINGIRYNVFIAHSSTAKASEARDKAAQLVVDIKSGTHRPSVQMTMKAAIDSFSVPHYENFTKDSKSAISIVDNYLRPFFEHLNVGEVTYTIVQDSVYALMDQGYAPESIRKRIQSGHLLFELLIRNGFSVTNPFKGINRPKVSNIRDVVLRPEQRLPYITCLREENSVFSDAILFQIATALRVSEAISVRIRDIDCDLSNLTLPETKSNKRQRIPLNSLAREVIERRIPLTHNEFLFPSPKFPDRHIASPRGCFNRIKLRMSQLGHDISELWQHDNRRTMATVSSEVSNGNSHLVAGLIRHSNTHILNRYVHCSNDAVAAVSEATAQALLTPNNEEEK